MARKKLERVPAYLKAKTRAASMASIDPALDLGNELTLAAYQKEIDKYTVNLSKYNEALSTVDKLYNEALAQEKQLKDWNERMLTGVASKWGKDSDQYEMAGGVRKSERKRPAPRAKKP